MAARVAYEMWRKDQTRARGVRRRRGVVAAYAACANSIPVNHLKRERDEAGQNIRAAECQRITNNRRQKYPIDSQLNV